jgi:hypothetical protein
LFERRYRAILVQKNDYLKELLRYIHLNPVRARVVADPADYPWSSHNNYLRLVKSDWLTVDHLAAMFGTEMRTARTDYLDFMSDQTSDATLRLLRDGVMQDKRVLGDEQWLREVLEDAGTVTPDTTLDDIVNIACQRHNVTEALLASRSRSRKHSTIRAEIALAATENGCATLTEVAKRFGRAHSGLSRAMNRLRDKKQ